MGWWARLFRRRERAPRDADEALRSALLALLDRDLDTAEGLLGHAARTDSSDTQSYVALARLFRMRGEIGRAIRIHQNLLLRHDLSPEETLTVLADLAADFRQGGFLQRAIASYEEVLTRDPRHVEALRALVPLLAGVHDYPRAIEMARRLARLQRGGGGSEESRLLVDMAEAAHAEGRSQDARRAVRRALRKDRRNVRGWIALGELEAERGRTKAALAAWRKVPTLDRRSGPQVYPQLEATFAALERPREFEALLRELLAERSDELSARLALARTLASRGEIDEAIAELRGALERDPDQLEAYGALGRLLLSEQRTEEAVGAFGELLDVLDRKGMLRSWEKLE